MKRYLLFCFLSLPFIVLAAQTNLNPGWSVTNSTVLPVIPSAGQGTSLLITLIPLLVPIILAVAKVGLKAMPSWILPILAPALGALLDYISSIQSGSAATPITGALLGSAGVGVREFVDQVRQKIATPTATNPPAT